MRRTLRPTIGRNYASDIEEKDFQIKRLSSHSVEAQGSGGFALFVPDSQFWTKKFCFFCSNAVFQMAPWKGEEIFNG
jgi:hypothetical protein